jgi:hypothetical protein
MAHDQLCDFALAPARGSFEQAAMILDRQVRCEQPHGRQVQGAIA